MPIVIAGTWVTIYKLYLFQRSRKFKSTHRKYGIFYVIWIYVTQLLDHLKKIYAVQNQNLGKILEFS